MTIEEKAKEYLDGWDFFYIKNLVSVFENLYKGNKLVIEFDDIDEYSYLDNMLGYGILQLNPEMGDGCEVLYRVTTTQMGDHLFKEAAKETKKNDLKELNEAHKLGRSLTQEQQNMLYSIYQVGKKEISAFDPTAMTVEFGLINLDLLSICIPSGASKHHVGLTKKGKRTLLAVLDDKVIWGRQSV